MARGFLSGVLWGGVVGVGMSSAASVMAPSPEAPQVTDMAPQSEAPQRVESASSGEEGSTPDRAPVTGSVAPQAPAPQVDTTLNLDTAALAAPAQPEAAATATLDAPQPETGTTGLTGSADVPVIPTPQALAPMAPQEADDVAINTAPAQPPVAEVVQPQVQAAPEGEIAETEATQTETAQTETAQIKNADADQGSDTPVAQDETVTAEVVEGETAQDVTQSDASMAEKPETEAPVTEQAAAETPSNDTDTENTQTAALAPETQVTPVTPPARVTEGVDAPETSQPATSILGGSARPRIGLPAGTIGDRNTGVTIRRPSSASLGEVDNGDVQEVADDAGVIAAPNDDPRPISRFSQAFEAEEGKPLMSIVLIDDGSSPVAGSAGIAALRGFPYPLSFAVDTSRADAAERMALYRKEGFEVLAMIDLPEGALPSDAETTFGAILPQMTEVVGVLEGTQGGLQGSREVADQVTSILLQTGHGLLAQDKGLNTMPKLARKEGVPADPIFRDFDSKGQTAAVIRRFLDQAAFKAGQEGAVVMLGRMRPDTVSALLLWGLQDRAGKVSLAPISAVLLRDQ